MFIQVWVEKPNILVMYIFCFFQNDLEKTLLSKFSTIQSALSPRPQNKLSVVSMEDELSMMHELTQVNLGGPSLCKISVMCNFRHFAVVNQLAI